VIRGDLLSWDRMLTAIRPMDGCRLKTLFAAAPTFVCCAWTAGAVKLLSSPGLGDADSVSLPSRRSRLVGAGLASAATQCGASASEW
jgi:hypothetical protein